MGTNCAPLLADLFLYSYQAEFVQSLLQEGKKHLAQQFNFTYRYIDDVLSLKNTKFAEYLEFIYPRDLEIKETTETAAFSSYWDCYLYIDNGKLTTRLYDKRDDFNFPIVNFPFLSSNIPSAPAYGIYVSQLIHYARTCSNYQDFLEWGKVLTTKLLSQGYQKTKPVATLKKLYGRHHDLVIPYNVAVSRIVSDVFASDAPLVDFPVPDIRFYRYFLRSGLWAWWAKLAYQVILTIRECLITPFILGSMSVGLNILICHSFMDLWVWITA